MNDLLNSQPPLNEIQELIDLFNKRQFQIVLKKTVSLTKQYPQSFYIWSLLGTAAVQLRMPKEAMQAFRKAIYINPNNPEILNNMGNLLKNEGKLDDALKAFKKALSFNPNFAEAYSNMATVMHAKGMLSQALKAYQKAITIKPNFFEALSNLGNIFKEQGKINKAIQAYYKAISINPNYAEAYYNLGICFNLEDKIQEALKVYQKAIALKPNYYLAQNNIGTILHKLGKFDEAIKFYNKAISINPNYAEAFNNLGFTLEKQNKIEEAIKAYYKAISINPKFARVYNNLGICLKKQNKLKEAIAAYQKSISLKPNYDLAFNNLGSALFMQGKPNKAIKAYNKAISINPNYAEAHKNLSFPLLCSHNYEKGFYEYEWRWKIDKRSLNSRFFSKPLWDGKASLLRKKILLWSEQGIGDTINWCSCLEKINSQAGKCILECQDKIVPLLKRSFPNIEIKPENRGNDLKRDDFEFHLPMGSIYKYFFQDITQKFKNKNYLVANQSHVMKWKKRLHSSGNGPFIGIVWKSSNQSPERLPNYAQISDLYPLLKIPNVCFVNLQYKDYEDDLKKVENEIGVNLLNFDDLNHYDDIDEGAALYSALDMIVSIKTTIPLISAALGTKTILANWKQSSWNNILFNPTSPSVEIYERNTWEKWDKVFNLIADNVVKFTKNWSN